MAVHSFSTRKLDRESEEVVEALKLYCIKNGLNFSHLVIQALKGVHRDLTGATNERR